MRLIDTADEYGNPCKAFVFEHTHIIYPSLSECGRFDVDDPLAYYGMTQDELDFLTEQEKRLYVLQNP